MTQAMQVASPAARTTVIVTQRERFGMTAESLESLYEHAPGVQIIYVDGNSPVRWHDYLAAEAASGRIRLIHRDHFLTPNEARNIGVAAADTEYVVFCDNDVVFTPGWLDRLVERADATGADVVAPLTCHGLPAHTNIHHAGGDYLAQGDFEAFFAPDAGERPVFDEVMHGHGDKVADWEGRLQAGETGMCEFHCVLVRRSVFDRIGPLDEAMLSTREHLDFSLLVKKSGGTLWFEPASVVTYVFPCRQRPINAEDWPFFALRWSSSYGRRSLRHFIAKWGLRTPPDYVKEKTAVYNLRRSQGMVIPLMLKMPIIGRSDFLAKGAARLAMVPERLLNDLYVARHDRQMARRAGSPVSSTRGAKAA